MDAVRSMLFTPGHRLDLIAKASRSAADAVIVDLEDAVATSAKDQARSNLASLPQSVKPFFVRVNGFETGLLWEDIASAVHAGVAGVILPKAEDRNVMLKLCGALSALETAAGQPEGSIALIPMIETAVGVQNAYEILDGCPRAEAVMFGSGEQGDLVADLGVQWEPTGTGLHYSRSRVLLAARAAGVPHPMDGVFMDFGDSEALHTESKLARRMGYVAKLAIHPAQVGVINEVFTPTPEEVAHHRAILEMFEKAEAEGTASIGADGKMIDYAVVRTARSLLGRAAITQRGT
ncbi:MAG: CoA ester lyase [Actinomycetia bacterium]|nr:CoA ester lyase [Actinomycetes bacterium]